MIIPKPQVTLIIQEKKKVHRVPVTTIVKTGRSIPVRPSNTGPVSCRIVVTDMQREVLGDIAGVQALEEGHKSLDDFKVAWVERFDPEYPRRQRQQMDEAQVPEAERDDYLRELELGRFDRAHASRDVWVLRFHLDKEERPRFMAARSEEGYVEHPYRAMPGEPEALGEREQVRQAEESRQAWATEQARRAAARAAMPLAERLRLAQMEGHGHPLASKRLRLIERQVQLLEDDLHGPGEAA